MRPLSAGAAISGGIGLHGAEEEFVFGSFLDVRLLVPHPCCGKGSLGFGFFNRLKRVKKP